MSNTFKRGIHPGDHKEITKDLQVEYIKAPQTLIIPLSQNIGAPCNPLVKVGDQVFKGQKIGDNDTTPVSAPVHSPVSGKVTAIQPRPNNNGGMMNSIVIENDYQETLDPSIAPKGKLEDLTPEEIIAAIREAGIVGMGGATFPAAAKIKFGLGAVDTVIVNAAECEPYLTADYRLMLEMPEKAVFGLKAIMKAFGVDKGFIGVEDNKPEGIAKLTEAAKDEPNITVMSLQTKYPQGGEKQLIYAVTGREVPSGKLPAEVGCAVFNLATCAAVSDAIQLGMPCIERIMTVTGEVNEPKNIMYKFGTTFEYIINECCGGLKDNVDKVISGGPMMGVAQHRLDVPAIKGTNGILCIPNCDYAEDPQCIRCGKCIEACPMGLLPVYMNLYASHGCIPEADKYNVLDCIECGACTYTCPAKLHLVQEFRVAKGRIQAYRKEQQAK
ncbi:MAG: electron transport complex subunit RsxC [Eubacteriales bacterium]|jgi:electron transport complex protein RnfC